MTDKHDKPSDKLGVANSETLPGFVPKADANLEMGEALARSNALLQTYFESSQLGIAFTSPDRGWLKVNRRACDMLGYTQEELRKLTWVDLTHPDDLDLSLEHFGRVLSGELDRYTLEKRFVKKNGEAIHVNLDISCYRKADQSVDYLIASVQDITERKRVEESLLQAKEAYERLVKEQRAILNAELFGIAKFKRRVVVWANPGFERIIGYASGEATGKSSRNHYLDAQAYESFGLAAYPVLAAGQSYSTRVQHVRKDGTHIWVEVRGVMLDIEQDESLWAFVDITDRVQKEEQLLAAKQLAERANLSKTRFLAAASHDLWQPIHAINSFQAALSKSGLDEKQEHLSAKLAESVQSLGDILSVLIEVSRLDSGTVIPRQEVLAAEELFYWVDSLFSPVALAKKLRFKLHYPAGDLALFTDSTLLRSLLGNLVGNAIRYTQRGGVLVGIRRRGLQARIQVWDTGSGIAAEHIEHIYDEYFQIGNPERDRNKGLGLGLSIVQRVSGLLAAPVTVRSRLGKGSVFEFTLPIAPPALLSGVEPGAKC